MVALHFLICIKLLPGINIETILILKASNTAMMFLHPSDSSGVKSRTKHHVIIYIINIKTWLK